MAYRIDPFQRFIPAVVAAGEVFQAGVQRLVRLSSRSRLEVRGADGAGAPGQARREPAPEGVGLSRPAEGAQRDQHARQIIVSGRGETRAEAEQSFGFLR